MLLRSEKGQRIRQNIYDYFNFFCSSGGWRHEFGVVFQVICISK